MTDIHAHRPLDLEQLIIIAGGHTAFSLLWAGVQLGLFDHLSANAGSSPEEIAHALGLEAKPARILLVGLTALRLIEKNGQGYRNDELTEQMLVTTRPGNVAPVLGWQAHIVYPGLINFVESLKQNRNVGLQCFPGDGSTLYERLTANADLESIFQDAMSALSAQAAPHLLSALDFHRFNHLVDVGGGDGSNAIALAQRYQNLKVTVFESSSICELAKLNIERNKLQDRVGIHAGEMFKDPFPEDIDAVLFSHIFTIWSLEKDTALLRKCYETLPVGGSALIFSMMAADDDTGPLSTALGSPYFLAIATGEGMLYSWQDYEACFREAGFSKVERIGGLPLNHGVLIGTK